MSYNITGFLDKNKDMLYQDFKRLLYSSQNETLKSMWPEGAQHISKVRRTVDGGRWRVGGGRWTEVGRLWTMEDGRWTAVGRLWTMEDGRWTVDGGRWWTLVQSIREISEINDRI